jgi:hypothetical protein
MFGDERTGELLSNTDSINHGRCLIFLPLMRPFAVVRLPKGGVIRNGGGTSPHAGCKYEVLHTSACAASEFQVAYSSRYGQSLLYAMGRGIERSHLTNITLYFIDLLTCFSYQYRVNLKVDTSVSEKHAPSSGLKCGRLRQYVSPKRWYLTAQRGNIRLLHRHENLKSHVL